MTNDEKEEMRRIAEQEILEIFREAEKQQLEHGGGEALTIMTLIQAISARRLEKEASKLEP